MALAELLTLLAQTAKSHSLAAPLFAGPRAAARARFRGRERAAGLGRASELAAEVAGTAAQARPGPAAEMRVAAQGLAGTPVLAVTATHLAVPLPQAGRVAAVAEAATTAEMVGVAAASGWPGKGQTVRLDQERTAEAAPVERREARRLRRAGTAAITAAEAAEAARRPVRATPAALEQ